MAESGWDPMKQTVHPGSRTGTVSIPASKSQAHRLLICAALGQAPAEIRCRGISKDIAATIGCLNALGAEIAVSGDCITGRGGGSMEDLWAFNDERVARVIYACETPVISAVGHEPDVTISDFVADARASTPSNAAEMAVPDQVDFRRYLGGLADRMTGSETARLQALRERLNILQHKRVLTDQLAYVQDKRMELVHLQQRLGDLAKAEIAQKQKAFTALAASLDAMSPLKVLGRGYAMARNEAGQVLKSSGEVTIGDRVRVTLGSGGFTAVVDHIEEEQHGG